MRTGDAYWRCVLAMPVYRKKYSFLYTICQHHAIQPYIASSSVASKSSLDVGRRMPVARSCSSTKKRTAIDTARVRLHTSDPNPGPIRSPSGFERTGPISAPDDHVAASRRGCIIRRAGRGASTHSSAHRKKSAWSCENNASSRVRRRTVIFFRHHTRDIPHGLDASHTVSPAPCCWS